jgi:hypothetical protein
MSGEQNRRRFCSYRVAKISAYAQEQARLDADDDRDAGEEGKLEPKQDLST